MSAQVKQPSHTGSTQDPYVIQTNCCIFPHHHYNPENNAEMSEEEDFEEGEQIEEVPDRVRSV